MSSTWHDPGMACPPDQLAWHVIVPVKGAPRGKSRLRGAAGDHAALTRAIARDTLDAVAATVGPAHTVLVSSDPVLTEASPYAVVPDPDAGLDAAVASGVAHVLRGPRSDPHGSSPPPLAALLGDLPALRSKDLRAALSRCAEVPRATVPDRQASGTVLVTSLDGGLPTSFGAGSAARHAALDYAVLALDLPRLRLDVDTPEDLASALRWGCGRHTAAVMASLAGLNEPDIE